MTTDLQTSAVVAKPEDRCVILYHAYRHAKAAWEVQAYAPEFFYDDLPEEINEPLCEANSAALNAYLLEPADDLQELRRKIWTFHEEEVQHLTVANEVVAVLAADADRLCKLID